MYKYIFLCWLVVLTTYQNIEAQYPTGIGPFKIGSSTTRIIDSIARITNRKIFKVTDLSTQVVLANNSTRILAINLDQKEISKPLHVPFDKNIKIYQINKYSILGKYTPANITLKFLRDTLFDITIEDPDFKMEQDLETKYGSPEHKLLSTKTTCYINHERFEFEDSNAYSIWNSGNIELVILLGESRKHDDCEKYYIHFLTVTDKLKVKEAEYLNKMAEAELDFKIKNQKIKELDSL